MKIELLNVRITIQKAVVLSDQYGNRRNDYETFYRCYATVSAEAGKKPLPGLLWMTARLISPSAGVKPPLRSTPPGTGLSSTGSSITSSVSTT